MRIHFLPKRVRRKYKVKAAKKNREAAEGIQQVLDQRTISQIALLLRQKSSSKDHEERKRITQKIDVKAIEASYRFGVCPLNKQDFIKAYLTVLEKERELASESKREQETKISPYHFAAEKYFSNWMQYFNFTLLYPQLRQALIKRAQQQIKAEGN